MKIDRIRAAIADAEATRADAELRGKLVDDRPGQAGIRVDPTSECPATVLADQVELEPIYYGFDGALHVGRIEIHKLVVHEVAALFSVALSSRFPIQQVVPASLLRWNDQDLMSGNYTSGFNFRRVAGRDALSAHALGLAIDINTRHNPYIRTERGEVIHEPPEAQYVIAQPGTLQADDDIVSAMEELGWEWGGNWQLKSHGAVDYQHFEKRLEPVDFSELLERYNLSGIHSIGFVNRAPSL